MQFEQWQRRELIALIGGAAAVGVPGVHAQQPVNPVIGFVSGGSADTFGYLVSAFREGLSTDCCPELSGRGSGIGES
jgi:hypothetical protein